MGDNIHDANPFSTQNYQEFLVLLRKLEEP